MDNHQINNNDNNNQLPYKSSTELFNETENSLQKIQIESFVIESLLLEQLINQLVAKLLKNDATILNIEKNSVLLSVNSLDNCELERLIQQLKSRIQKLKLEIEQEECEMIRKQIVDNRIAESKRNQIDSEQLETIVEVAKNVVVVSGDTQTTATTTTGVNTDQQHPVTNDTSEQPVVRRRGRCKAKNDEAVNSITNSLSKVAISKRGRIPTTKKLQASSVSEDANPNNNNMDVNEAGPQALEQQNATSKRGRNRMAKNLKTSSVPEDTESNNNMEAGPQALQQKATSKRGRNRMAKNLKTSSVPEDAEPNNNMEAGPQAHPQQKNASKRGRNCLAKNLKTSSVPEEDHNNNIDGNGAGRPQAHQKVSKDVSSKRGRSCSRSKASTSVSTTVSLQQQKQQQTESDDLSKKSTTKSTGTASARTRPATKSQVDSNLVDKAVPEIKTVPKSTEQESTNKPTPVSARTRSRKVSTFSSGLN